MADGLVCPSCHEPLGNVILEACHYGVPVVTTRSFGAEELVTDGHSGLMVPVADPEALAYRIRDLLDAEVEQVDAPVTSNRRRALQRGGSGQAVS